LAEAISPLTGSCSLSLAIGLVSTGLLPGVLRPRILQMGAEPFDSILEKAWRIDEPLNKYANEI